MRRRDRHDDAARARGARRVPPDRPPHRQRAGPRRALRDELRRIPNVRNAFAVVSLYVQTIGIIVARGLDRQPGSCGSLAFVLMGRAHAQFAALMHEAAHRLLFRNRKRQRLGRALAARLPVVHADRPVPPRAHGAPPRRVRPRRARHPAVPRLPDRAGVDAPQARPRRDRPDRLEALQGPAARRRAPTDAAGALAGPAHRRRAARAHRDRRRAAATRGCTSSCGSRRISPSGASSTGCARSPSTAACSGRRTAASPRTRCGSTRSPASSSCRSTSAGTSRTTSTPACRWRTCRSCTPSSVRAGLRHRRDRVPELPRALAQALQRLSRRRSATPHVTTRSRGADRRRTDDRSTRRSRRHAGAGPGPPARAPTRSTTRPCSRCSSSPSRATAGQRRRCEFVVVRDPDVRHQLARTYRQGWSIYKRVPAHPRRRRRRSSKPASGRPTTSRTCRCIIVACVRGRRPLFPAIGAAAFYARRVPGGAEPPARRGRARPRRRGEHARRCGRRWEARRTLGLPAAVTPVAVVAARVAAGRPGAAAPVAPVGNLVHLDRYGHQPFRVAPGTDGVSAPATSRRGIMGVTTSRQVTTCPEKDERAASVKRAKLKQGYDDGLFREGSGTLADVDEQVRRRRRRTTTTSTTTRRRRGLGPGPPRELA